MALQWISLLISASANSFYKPLHKLVPVYRFNLSPISLPHPLSNRSQFIIFCILQPLCFCSYPWMKSSPRFYSFLMVHLNILPLYGIVPDNLKSNYSQHHNFDLINYYLETPHKCFSCLFFSFNNAVNFLRQGSDYVPFLLKCSDSSQHFKIKAQSPFNGHNQAPGYLSGLSKTIPHLVPCTSYTALFSVPLLFSPHISMLAFSLPRISRLLSGWCTFTRFGTLLLICPDPNLLSFSSRSIILRGNSFPSSVFPYPFVNTSSIIALTAW